MNELENKFRAFNKFKNISIVADNDTQLQSIFQLKGFKCDRLLMSIECYSKRMNKVFRMGIIYSPKIKTSYVNNIEFCLN